MQIGFNSATTATIGLPHDQLSSRYLRYETRLFAHPGTYNGTPARTTIHPSYPFPLPETQVRCVGTLQPVLRSSPNPDDSCTLPNRSHVYQRDLTITTIFHRSQQALA